MLCHARNAVDVPEERSEPQTNVLVARTTNNNVEHFRIFSNDFQSILLAPAVLSCDIRISGLIEIIDGELTFFERVRSLKHPWPLDRMDFCIHPRFSKS